MLPAEDFIFWNTRPIGRGYKGRSALEAVWTDLIYIRELKDSMTMFGRKMGSGIFVITTSATISDELKASMNTAYADVSNRRAIVMDGSAVNKSEFIGPQGATTDFEQHINTLLGNVAAGCGVPKDVLVGATAGAITGSETNVKSLFATLNQIQTSIEPYIRELVRRMGYSNEDYNIEWNTRYAHDEEDESKIGMNNANTLATRAGWLTINEIRAIEGYGPKEGGDRLKSDFQIDVKGMQTADEQDATNNPQGENL